MNLDQQGMGHKCSRPCKPSYNFEPYSKGKPLKGFTQRKNVICVFMKVIVVSMWMSYKGSNGY